MRRGLRSLLRSPAFWVWVVLFAAGIAAQLLGM